MTMMRARGLTEPGLSLGHGRRPRACPRSRCGASASAARLRRSAGPRRHPRGVGARVGHDRGLGAHSDGRGRCAARPGTRPAHRPLLRAREPIAQAREGDARARLRGCRLACRRDRGLGRGGPSGRSSRRARRRAARSLQPTRPDPGDRRRRPGAAARRERARRRRGRPRLTGCALPRRGRHRPPRDRGRRPRGRVEPPASGASLDGRARGAEGRVGRAEGSRAEPGRGSRRLPGAAQRGQRRPDPRRGLGGDRRRRRQLPDALPAERRLGLARHPRRPRLDLPLRGPGDRLRFRSRARAIAASFRSRLRPSSRRAAPRAACWECFPA